MNDSIPGLNHGHFITKRLVGKPITYGTSIRHNNKYNCVCDNAILDPRNYSYAYPKTRDLATVAKAKVPEVKEADGDNQYEYYKHHAG